MSPPPSTDVLIVGAGPAGLAATQVLREQGLDVVLLDEAPRAGGQIFRQLPEEFRGHVDPRFVAPSHHHGDELLAGLSAGGARLETGVTVFDIEPGRAWLERDGETRSIEASRILLATGAMDRSVPFPGWTLPGVITAGAAQVLVRGQQVRPGTRAVVAGTGPLLLPTVTALLSAGVRVEMLLEANRYSRMARAAAGVFGNRARRREAMHYARLLLGHRIRMRTGHAVFAAHGRDKIERVLVGRLDRQGRPLQGTQREVPVDLLCVGFGLQPATELCSRLGCRLRHDPARGGWLPEHDENQQTSVPGVFVAGEVAGIGGAEVAIAEGRLAGFGIAASLGRDVSAGIAQARRVRHRERRDADRMLQAFPLLPGLHELAGDRTVVCRCEDVTLGQVREAVRTHGDDIKSVKMATRAGMGPCQARVCHPILADQLECRLGGRHSPTPPPSVQMPVKPIAVSTAISRSEEA